MKVLKKHLKYLKSANVYPNGLIFFFEKHDKETNISFDYRIKLSRTIEFYDRFKETNPICDRLHFYFYSYEKPVNPLQLVNINHVSIYSDNASTRQKEKGISNEYVKVIFKDDTFLVSQKYRINDEINLHCIDHFNYSFHGSSAKHYDDYTAIHTIKAEE